jgi:hypothetical protein
MFEGVVESDEDDAILSAIVALRGAATVCLSVLDAQNDPKRESFEDPLRWANLCDQHLSPEALEDLSFLMLYLQKEVLPKLRENPELKPLLRDYLGPRMWELAEGRAEKTYPPADGEPKTLSFVIGGVSVEDGHASEAE